MHERFGADTFGDDYEREFTAAIVGHASPTLESMLLNAADSLDIGRVTEFDFKYFPFLRGGEQEGPKALVPEYQNLRQALHEEADLLARMTDPLTQTRDLRMKLIQAGEAEDMVHVQRAASEAVAGQLGPLTRKKISSPSWKASSAPIRTCSPCSPGTTSIRWHNEPPSPAPFHRGARVRHSHSRIRKDYGTGITY